MNINQFVQFIKFSKNPQQAIINILQQQTNNNPIVMNLMQMARNGNITGIEQVAKNIMNEKGLDFNTEFNNFKRNFGF